MIAVIIAGGSGTRLWPLSTPDHPKHLLSLTDDKSLLQNSLGRVRQLTTDDKIIIIPEASHSHLVEAQLEDFPKSNLLIEPARRGTASCVLLAMQHIKRAGLDPNEPIAIMWADHLIRDENGFCNTFKRAGKLARKHRKIIFIGAEPTYPSTGFGYMEHGDAVDGEAEAYQLLKFHEKPDHRTAEKYYASGRFFWNMGYLVTTLEAFEDAAQTYSPDYWQTYQRLLASSDVENDYLKLDSIALDYALSEKIKGALVIPGAFDWIDLGSFGDLHSISVRDEAGNCLNGECVAVDGVTNSYVHSDDSLPIAIIGLDNVVVIHSKNGILVANKNFAQKVGDVSKQFQSKRAEP